MFPDLDRWLPEYCLFTIGQPTRSLIAVMFTERPPAVRLISARLVTRPEREVYEAGDICRACIRTLGPRPGRPRTKVLSGSDSGGHYAARYAR